MIAEQKNSLLPALPPMRRRLLHGLQKALHWSGVATLYTRLGAVAGATILMYHSISASADTRWIDPANTVAADQFEAQMRFLREHRRVISLATLIENLRTGNDVPAGTVVITFDDGYLDNLLVAAPILARFGLPATIYLPTVYIDRQQNQWIDDLYSIFRNRQRHELQWEEQSLNLRNPVMARRAYSEVASKLRSCTFSQRQQILCDLHNQLQPDALPPRLTLSWHQVRELKRSYSFFEVGVHTVNHLDLSEHPDAAMSEISQSIGDVERELGIRPRHFSYPYGRSCEAARRAVLANGLMSAVVGGTQYLIDKFTEPLSLCRLPAPNSIGLIAFWTSGAYPGLSKALFGRA